MLRGCEAEKPSCKKDDESIALAMAEAAKTREGSRWILRSAKQDAAGRLLCEQSPALLVKDYPFLLVYKMMSKKESSGVRVAPNSKESEMMVLGCMLTSINSLNIASDGLEDIDFYYTEHQKIFSSLRTAYRQDKPADIHIIAEDLKKQNQLDEIGGISYLTTLAQFAGTSAYIEEYVALVKEKAILRRMIHAAQTIEKEAFSEPDDVSVALDDAQARFFQISQATQGNYGATLKDLISGSKAESGLPYLKELEERQQRFQERGPNDPTTTGIPTHFIDLDKMLNGFGNSNLVILASRPAMGKTSLALGICESICFKNQIPVGIFSLEMSADQLLHRLICSQAEVESDKIQTGSLNGAEYQRIVSAVHFMQKQTMVIDDQPGLKVTDLRARARRMKETHKIGFLMIDYLQLISGSGTMRSMENRQVEISEISRMLKTLARELNIPVLCLAQLSRRVEERQGHRPMMSDLRESGSIEQDSDVVLFLLRREYYDPYDKPGMAEIIVAKNRHGPVGSVHLTYRKEISQFANYTGQDLQAAKASAKAFSPFDG